MLPLVMTCSAATLKFPETRMPASLAFTVPSGAIKSMSDGGAPLTAGSVAIPFPVATAAGSRLIREARELEPGVCGRIPIRTNRDDRYLTEKFQALPADGYTALIEKILDHPKIDLELGTDLKSVIKRVSFTHLIYSGPVDDFFRCCFGPLPQASPGTGGGSC